MSSKSHKEFRANLIASAATGATIMTFTNPLDTLRCRWQVAAEAESLLGFVKTAAREEGLWRGFWRPGLPPNVLAMAMAIGGRNGFYPVTRDSIGTLLGSDEKVGPRGMFIAGLLAGMTGYFFASPLLQIKTQMQAEAGKVSQGIYVTGLRTGLPPTYSNSINAAHHLAMSGFNEAGVLGCLQSLWRGSGVIVGRGAAVAASQLAAYDSTKTVLKTQGLMADGPLLHVVASQVAAVCCTTFSMPLDVVLTVYTSAQTLGGERKALYGSGGPLSCAAAMLRADGPTVFFRGWIPAFLRISPTTVSSFFLYEQLRHLVGIGYLD